MELAAGILERRSIRSFKPEPVPRKVLEELLGVCRWAPSGSNTQPWEFAILGGKVMEELKARLVEKADKEWDTVNLRYRNIYPDIPYPELPEPYRQRALESRSRIDSHQFPSGTEQIDKKRTAYRLYGASFYGAPNAIIIYAAKSLGMRPLLGIGIISQTIALAALNYGLGTCLMGMVVYWPDILRELLAIPDSKLIALGIAIGYPDLEGRVNSMVRTREPLEAFAHWHGF